MQHASAIYLESLPAGSCPETGPLDNGLAHAMLLQGGGGRSSELNAKLLCVEHQREKGNANW